MQKAHLRTPLALFFATMWREKKNWRQHHNKAGAPTLTAYASVDALPWVSRELAKPSYTEPALPRKYAGCCVAGACVSEIVAQCARSTASVA